MLIALILAFGGAPAHAGLSTNCVAADGGATSLLVQVKDKKGKKNKHGDDHNGRQSHDDGLTECTIQSPGSGGGCKSGFNYVVRENEERQEMLRLRGRQRNAKQAPAGKAVRTTTFCGGTTSRPSPSNHPLKAVRKMELCCCHTLNVI